jgi:hypothetical protein
MKRIGISEVFMLLLGVGTAVLILRIPLSNGSDLFLNINEALFFCLISGTQYSKEKALQNILIHPITLVVLGQVLASVYFTFFGHLSTLLFYMVGLGCIGGYFLSRIILRRKMKRGL